MSPGSHSNGNSNCHPNDKPPDVLVDFAFGCDLMDDPVVAADGHTYERKDIEKWFAQGKTTSPATGAQLMSLSLVTNYKILSAINEWHAKRGGSGSAAVAVCDCGSAGGSAVAGGSAGVGGGSAVAGGGSAVVGGGRVAWSSDSDDDSDD